MNRAEAVAELRVRPNGIRAMGATSLYLFGSAARDESGPTSDLDLFIDYDMAGKFSLISWASSSFLRTS